MELIGAFALGYFGSLYWTRLQRACVEGGYLAHQGRYKTARKTLAMALVIPHRKSETPWWALATNLLCYLEIKLGREAQAHHLLKKLESAELEKPLFYLTDLRRADLAARSGMVAEAKKIREVARDLFDESKDNVKAYWKALAFFAFGSDEYDLATFSFDRLVESTPNQQWYYFRAFSCELSGAENSRVLQYVKDALGHCKERNLKFYLQLNEARLLLELRDYEALESALNRCQDLLNVNSRGERHFYFSTLTQMSRKLRRQGLDYANHFLALNTATRVHEFGNERDIIELRYKLTLLRDTGLFLSGQELLDNTPSHPNLYYARGAYQLALGRPADAIVSLEPLCDRETSPAFRPSPSLLSAQAAAHAFRWEDALQRYELFRHHESLAFSRLRAEWAYIWEGNPTLAESLCNPQNNAVSLLYRGKFQELSQLLSDCKLVPTSLVHEYRIGTLDFFRATVHHWQGDFAGALVLYKSASAWLEEDATKQELCTLYSLECRAYLGENIVEQHRAQQIRLGDLFPQSQMLQADARLSGVDCRFALRQFEEALSLAIAALEKEPRAFARARLTELKGLCQENLGRPAEAREAFGSISKLVPESFLEARNREKSK